MSANRREFAWAETSSITFTSNPDGTFNAQKILTIPLNASLQNRRVYGYVFPIFTAPAAGFHCIKATLRLSLEGEDILSIPLNYYFQSGTPPTDGGPNRPSIANGGEPSQDTLVFQPISPLVDDQTTNGDEPDTTYLQPFRADFPADLLRLDIDTITTFHRFHGFIASHAW